MRSKGKNKTSSSKKKKGGKTTTTTATRPTPPNNPPPSPAPPLSWSSDRRGAENADDYNDDHLDKREEASLLDDLRTRTRSLLASMKGAAPDGSPFVAATTTTKTMETTAAHPLAVLFASISERTEKLIEVQRRRKARRMRRRQRNLESCDNGGDNNNDGSGKGGNVRAKQCLDVAQSSMSPSLTKHWEMEEEEDEMGKENEDQRSDRSDTRVWDAFLGWLSQRGIGLAERGFPVEIRKTTTTSTCGGGIGGGGGCDGYGLFATRPIGYGETILEIPVSAMLSPYFDYYGLGNDNDDGVDDDDDGDGRGSSPPRPRPRPPPPFDPDRPTATARDQGLGQLCLVMHIVNELWKGPASAHWPYLNTLPSIYTTPLYWSATSIAMLKDTSHLKRAVTMQSLTMWEYLQMRDSIVRAHSDAVEDVGDAGDAGGGEGGGELLPVEDFHYEDFRWATATAHTRQNLIPFVAPGDQGDDDGDDIVVRHAFALVPLWDMINHEDSDKACRSEVSLIDDDNDDSEGGDDGDARGGSVRAANGGDVSSHPRQSDDHNHRHWRRKRRRRRGVLVCRTPISPPAGMGTDGDGGGGAPCFDVNDEIKMHYGDRTSAQLLFHSGFVDGGRRRGSGGERTNLNRHDRAVLRFALPSAESELGLGRVREMVAARFGFRAYPDQGVGVGIGMARHDGLDAAHAAAAAAFVSGEVRGDAIAAQCNAGRGESEVVMMDVEVAPGVACSDELRRALLLCLADKVELAHLLRNVERYMSSPRSCAEEVEDGGGGGTAVAATEDEREGGALLDLGGKHLDLVTRLVDMRRKKVMAVREREDSSLCLDASSSLSKNIWIDPSIARGLADDLLYCDQITLEKWYDEFRSQFN